MFNTIFGFSRKTLEDETIEINVNESFFRFVCCKVGNRGEKVFLVTSFAFFVIGWIAFFSSYNTFGRLCKSGEYFAPVGPNCDHFFLLALNNQVSLLVCVFLSLVFFNLMCNDNNRHRPAMVDIQWTMATALSPNSMTAFIYYYAVIIPGSTVVDIFSFSVWFCAIVMYFVFGIGGLYETRLKHVLWSTFSMLQLLIGVAVFEFTKPDPTKRLETTHILAMVAIGLLVNFTAHFVLYLIFQCKMKRHGFTRVKTAHFDDEVLEFTPDLG